MTRRGITLLRYDLSNISPLPARVRLCQALGDRNQYHIYLEEVDSLPDVWERRRSVPGDLPPEVAGDLLLAGRAYAQLPSEVYLVFLKIERRVSKYVRVCVYMCICVCARVCVMFYCYVWKVVRDAAG